MASIEDLETLLDGVGRGERGDFHRLYELTGAKLFGLCRAVLDDRAWAEEVLEEIYVALWHGATEWKRDRLTPLTWILTLGRSQAIAARREAAGDSRPDPVELQRVALPREVLQDGSDARPLLRTSLSWLPKDRREAFLLSYFSGVSYADLATRYRVPLATVRNWQRRSLQRLYRDLTGGTADEDIVLAAEYSLGLLPEKERRIFETRVMMEEALQLAVAGWGEDFIVLTDALPDIAPPASMLTRLDQRIFTEQSKPLWRRVRLFQSLVMAAAAASVAWLAITYWPGMVTPDGLPVASAPQQSVTAISTPPQLDPLPTAGPPLALLDPASGIIQVGGDLSALRRIPNLAVFLDFGGGTEWVSLGGWPELPPHDLAVPIEIVTIASGADLVILGGPGSDQEAMRVSVQ